MITRRTTANLFLAIGALSILALPGLLISGWQWTSNLENRSSAPFPTRPTSIADVARFSGEFESWFQDHVGLRSPLLRLKTWLEFDILRHSTTPRVLLGRDGWLFYAGDRSFEDFTGQIQLSDEELETWFLVVRQRERWLRERGIAYYFFWAPNKQSIYPEYLPPGIRRAPANALDQVMRHLEQRSADENLHLPMIDLRGRLQAEKSAMARGPLLCHSIDNHWNAYGAYVGYDELARRIAKEHPGLIRRVELLEKDFAPAIMTGGDLSSMLMLAPYPRPMPSTQRLVPLADCAREATPDAGNYRGTVRVDQCTPATPGPKVLIFHDSMIEAMRDYLSHSFGTVRYRGIFPSFEELTAEVQRERPDLVIEERVERVAWLIPELEISDRLSLVPAPEAAERDGWVDGIRIEPGGRAIVEGWGRWNAIQRGSRIKVFTSLPVASYQLTAVDRPDVVTETGDPGLLHSGFRVTLFLVPGYAPGPEPGRLCVWTEDPTYGKRAQRFSRMGEWDACLR